MAIPMPARTERSRRISQDINDSAPLPAESFVIPRGRSGVAPPRASELDAEDAKFHIAPLGQRLDNFLFNATLLFLPYFYSSRVYPVLSSATLAEEEMTSKSAKAAFEGPIMLDRWPDVKRSWSAFLDSFRNEWQTLNVVSALLLTAIYNALLLGGQGSTLIQCTALMSLFSALMSLTLGCLYLIRFETMRRTYKAMQWSSDAKKTLRKVYWNIYTLLALPSAWLAWSLIFFVVCLMSIVWQPIDSTIGSTSGLGPLHLTSKIAVSALLFVGMVHLSFALVAFAGYGRRMDKSWSEKLRNFRRAAADSVHRPIRPLAHADRAEYADHDDVDRADYPDRARGGYVDRIVYPDRVRGDRGEYLDRAPVTYYPTRGYVDRVAYPPARGFDRVVYPDPDPGSYPARGYVDRADYPDRAPGSYYPRARADSADSSDDKSEHLPYFVSADS